MELRGTPGLSRTLAPTGAYLAAGVAGGVAWAVAMPDRRLAAVAVVLALTGAVELVRALRRVTLQQRAANNWLRTATGDFVPPAYAWRAHQLTSSRERRTLARTLRLIEHEAFDRPRRRTYSLRLTAVREHRECVHELAEVLDRLDEPVTPAGMLRVLDLITNGASPLWAGMKGPTLGNTITTTLVVLKNDRSAGCGGTGAA
jgi:hypothetical protein